MTHSSSQSSAEALRWLKERGKKKGSRRASADDGASAAAASGSAAGPKKRSMRHSASGSDLQSVITLLNKVRKMDPEKINPTLRKRVRVIAEKHLKRERRRASQGVEDASEPMLSADMQALASWLEKLKKVDDEAEDGK